MVEHFALKEQAKIKKMKLHRIVAVGLSPTLDYSHGSSMWFAAFLEGVLGAQEELLEPLERLWDASLSGSRSSWGSQRASGRPQEGAGGLGRRLGAFFAPGRPGRMGQSFFNKDGRCNSPRSKAKQIKPKYQPWQPNCLPGAVAILAQLRGERSVQR